MVNPGGSLTGGSLAKNAGLLSRGSDIKRLEDEAAALEGKAKETENAYISAAEALNEVKADITAEKAEITTANEDKIRFLTELKRIGELKTAAENSLKQLKEESPQARKSLPRLRRLPPRRLRI